MDPFISDLIATAIFFKRDLLIGLAAGTAFSSECSSRRCSLVGRQEAKSGVCSTQKGSGF